MSKEVDFSTGTVVQPDWLDAMQEINSGLAINFDLEVSGTDKVRVVAGTDKDQVSIVVNGLMRYTTSTKETAALSGAAGTFNIFATADTNDREFALVADTAAAPTGATNYRKVGEAVWSGTAITEVRSMAGPAPSHNPVFTGTVTMPTPSAGSDGAVTATTEWVRDYIASLNIFSVGDIKAHAGTTPPSGWLLCDGSAVLRTGTYADLFALIGTSFGVGDGSTTFNLPDLRGRTIAGLDDMNNTVGTGGGDAGRLDWANTRGTAGGTQYHTLLATEMPAHSHTVNSHSHGGATGGATASIASASTGGASVVNHSHDPTYGPNFCGTAGVADWGGNRIANGTANRWLFDTDTDTRNTDHTHGVSISQNNHAHGITAEAPGTNSQGGGGAHNNMQPTMLLNYIIKF